MLRQIAFLSLLLSTPALAGTLFVADGKGIREVDYDGITIRSIIVGKARWPRITPDHKELIYFAPDRGELRRVALDTGTTATVVKLPSKFRLCETVKRAEPNRLPEYSLADLSVSSPGDFTIDKSGQFACLNLMDRNANMAHVAFELRVPLNGGKLVTMVSLPRGCDTPKVQSCRQLKNEASSKTKLGHYGVQDGWLTAGHKKLVQLGPGDFKKEAVSPSGKWVVIGGNGQDTDSVERQVFLLDQKTGVVRTIDETSKELTQDQLRTMDVKSASVADDTDIRWLDDGVLLVGTELFRPDKGGLSLGLVEVAR